MPTRRSSIPANFHEDLRRRRGATHGATMHRYEVEVYRDGRWYMIRIPEIDGLTQARHPREIDDIANFPAR